MSKKGKKEKPTSLEIACFIVDVIATIAAIISAIRWW